MTAPPRMIRADLNLNAFNRWAASRGLVGARGAFDEGYALHALLTGCFGDLAPRPFRLVAARRQPLAVLYGYGAGTAEALADRARRCADPLQAAALPPASLNDKAMPGAWEAGATFGFEVRLRPVRRVDGPDGRDRAVERDAFQHEAEARPPGAMDRSRQDVYADWLAERLDRQGGAVLEPGATLAHFRRVPVLRKAAGGDRHWSEGPDAVLRGRLTVRDGPRFGDLLAQGIGRHKAFGYGMVLLRPC